MCLWLLEACVHVKYLCILGFSNLAAVGDELALCGHGGSETTARSSTLLGGIGAGHLQSGLGADLASGDIGDLGGLEFLVVESLLLLSLSLFSFFGLLLLDLFFQEF